MTSFAFEHELWVQDDEQVGEMVTWAREQNEHGLDELWFAIVFEGEDPQGGECEGGTGSYKDAPSTYRLN